MTSKEPGTPTPAKVAKLATDQVLLDRTALIGTFGSDANPGALVREGNGTVTRVTVGDKVAGGVVAAIAPDRLVLSRHGKTEVLELPRS